MILKGLIIILPWSLKRRALNYFYKYQIHPTAKIGLAWVFPTKLVMQENSNIDHFTVAVHLDSIEMEANCTIGRSNWITGFPSDTDSKHFKHQPDRRSKLVMKENSAVTKKHHIDCTNEISIGKFATIAGYNSQLLTHSINIYENRQDSKPILIGDYAFVGTNVTILGGAVLPAKSVLGANSLLNKKYEQEFMIYGGNPAVPLKEIAADAKYFNRTDGFVY